MRRMNIPARALMMISKRRNDAKYASMLNKAHTNPKTPATTPKNVPKMPGGAAFAAPEVPEVPVMPKSQSQKLGLATEPVTCAVVVAMPDIAPVLVYVQ